MWWRWEDMIEAGKDERRDVVLADICHIYDMRKKL